MSKLGSLLDRDHVLALAGDRFLERGERYVSEGRVRAVDEDDSAIAGIVSGTADYEVRIWVEGDDLAHACDCPIGVDGTFCKHLVALAVAWLGDSADRLSTKRPGPRQSRDRPRPITMADVRAYLDGQDHGTLVEMMLSEADRDDRLRERLLIRTTMAAAAGAGAGQIRRAIDRAVRIGSFVDYAGAYDFARGIHDAIDLVEDLLRADQPWPRPHGRRCRRSDPDHPADSIPIYQREVNTLLDTKRNDGYEAAVKLLGRIRALMIRLDRQHDFAPYLASVRTAHGRKRNFTKLLDNARW